MQTILSFVLLVSAAGCSHVVPLTKAAPSEATAVLSRVPFTLHDNRLVVQVMLNGNGPYSMIFDTGGANTITPRVRRQLGLASQGMDVGEGAGSSAVTFHSVHMRSLKIGSLKLTDQKFMVMNLEKIRRTFNFAHLDGILGLELLQRGRVRIDFDNQQIVFLDLGSSDRMANTEAIAIELEYGKPVIAGKINGQSARILLDTGDRSNLTVFNKYARSSHLGELFDRREQVITEVGLGGAIPGKIASIRSIKLADHEVTDVLARLPLTSGGFFAESDLSASVGIGLLKGFNLEFDYKNRKIYLQRRADFSEPSTFVPVKR